MLFREDAARGHQPGRVDKEVQARQQLELELEPEVGLLLRAQRQELLVVEAAVMTMEDAVETEGARRYVTA